MYIVETSGKPFPRDSLIESLTEMATSGSSNHRLSAVDSLAYISQTRDGEQMVTQSYCGEVHRRVDFAAQELTVGCFHLHVIDFRDPAPLQEALMRSTGNVGNAERKQCALLHLASGIFRNASGRSKRAPCRGRFLHWRMNFTVRN